MADCGRYSRVSWGNKTDPITPHWYRGLMDHMMPLTELQEEVEALEAIYIHELEVIRNDRDDVSQISLQLHPATGDEEDKKYVCMTLQLSLPEDYPDTVPAVSIRNPRGIGDEEIHSLLEDMKQLATERLGGPMLYELIELAKDSLTVGNIPHCLCMICLDHFHEGERFTRTDCYHYFHKSCLARYIQHFLSNDEETKKTTLTLHMNLEKRKIQCPVCREEIGYEEDSLTFSPVEEKFLFQPTDEMKQLQAEMAERLEKQRAIGGLIDVDAEKNKFLLKNDDVIQLPAKPVEEPKERKKSPRDRRDNDKFSLRRNRDRPDRRDRPDHRDKNQDNWRNKDERNKDERTKRDFNKPSSGFVRGKGRGKELEGRNFDKTGHKDRNNRKDEREREVNKIENKKSTGSENTEDERLSLVTKTKSVEIPDDDNKTKNSKAEIGPVQSEQQDKELCKPRFDEKINDRHKSDSVEKMTDRTSEYSSHTEYIVAGAAGSSNETVKCDVETIEIDTLTTQPNDETNENKHDNSKDENVTGNKKHTGRGGFGKPPSDSKDRRDSQTKSENAKNVNAKGNESHKGRGGFGKPPSDSKERTDSQTKGVNSKNIEAKSNNGRGGFGKPPSDSEDRTDNQTKSENPKNIEAKSHEWHKGRGGFGKPPSDSKDKTDSQTKSENPKSIDAKSIEQNKAHGGFGKPPSDIKGGETESPDHDGYKTNNKPVHQDNRTKSDGKYKEHYDRSSNRKEMFHDKRDKQYRDKYESNKKNYDRYDKSNGQRSDDDKYGRLQSSSDKVGDRFYNAHEKHDVDSDHLLDKRSDRNYGRHRQDKYDKKSEKNPSYSDIKHNDQGFDRKRHIGGFGKPGFDNRRNERDRYHSDRVQSRNKDIDHKPELWEDAEPNTDIKTEGQKPSGGFGKPNSNKKSKEMIERNCDDWKDKEIGSELSGKGETHEDRNSQRARGGFGRPNPRRNSYEHNDDSNWNEIDKHPDHRNPKKESRDSFDERPRGGFGRPNSGFETKRLDFNEKDDNELQKPRNDLRIERPYSRHDRRPETKRNDRRKDYRNDQRNDYRHDQRNDHKKDNRFDYKNDCREENRHDYRNYYRHDHRDDYRKEIRHDYRKDQYKDIDDNDKNERLAGSSKSDSHNWRENRTQPRDDEAGKHNKHSKADNGTHVDGGSKGDFYTREDSSFKNKENDRKCDSGANEVESRTENVIRHSCDTRTDCKTDRTSHPPGFRVGPPPGFHKETKSAESIKPPPGF